MLHCNAIVYHSFIIGMLFSQFASGLLVKNVSYTTLVFQVCNSYIDFVTKCPIYT